MSAILDHVWGVSPAADRVWAQVSGLAPSRSAKRLFMVLQAFCDESVTQNGWFVLAGLVATAENWAKFSAEWEALLPEYGIFDRSTKSYHFKMKMMWSLKRDHVFRFYEIIEKYSILSISCAVNSVEFEIAKKRIYVAHKDFSIGDIPLGVYGNIYLSAFRGLMDNFHGVRFADPELISLLGNEKIDFYFDEKTEKKVVARSWDEYVENRHPNLKRFYGKEPRFEDDRDFLPLQAADFIAWWVRKWYEMAADDKNLIFGEYCIFQKKRRLPAFHILMTEDTLIKVFTQVVLDKYVSQPQFFWTMPGVQIYNVKFDYLAKELQGFTDLSGALLT